MKNVFVLTISCLFLAACAPKIHHQGKPVDESNVEQIQKGISTKHDVARLLGSPTMASVFQDDRWYYASRTTETNAFLKPVATQQDIFVVTFNDQGIVTDFKHLGLDDSQGVDYVNRETPTSGKDSSMLQQMFGNFGRITRSDKTAKP